ncbi:MAG: UDP-N-acetylmuramoyl-L-alanyl-D-glutamate--2,6-diaminopimelate ligase [Bacteroidaceae bacterium]|nr:UDP-N-acetylmuramoyl-L-alanyl-D-glutamate--2,6-diaminopimelate ligase [Prevotellaceae bacterium]MDD7657284.1 UDP-N-acetylmuramoyl-L-alanyl-D-glutamate--2,6-diaminopimelate ligase [Prevotellaceae bacterium]MDY5598178.1 UDP-N-acetylmuramoyl-L-alanyl-D-glutamate--2,6-diaminopimelate ligase [Bacteroidaceae bacterium]MDY5673695.1 UDP-N-acetylmuramoyl-L-alanyl-D-glutamate--2,6-diaminopimelate ligase [Bacteroidaceae bacterium]
MKLNQLIKDCQPAQTVGEEGREVKSVQIDSRKVQPGDLFVALRGTQVDGHEYIEKAIGQGATAVVCESLPQHVSEDVTYLVYPDTELAVGPLATACAGNPSQRMKLVGVTGTNGKTTIATVLYNMFRRMGYKCGLCSTVCNYIDGRPIPTECTTPDAVTLNNLLGQMADEGCEYAFMEVSSHSVAQHRIGGLTFAGGIFTNLTRDHLDYHKTFENYRDAKKAFFDALPREAFAVTNADDRNGMVMVQNTRAQVKTYSVRGAADFRGRILEESFEGMNLEMDGREVFVQFVGRFNVSNLLAVYAAAVLLGVEPDEALVQLSAMKPVNGRFESIRSPKGVTAIVDYAHTPDALVNVLQTINDVLQHRGECWTVCGAGGNRDRGKRPIMAKVAVENSDRVIITSDNPRFEDPQAIIDDMLAGLSEEQRQSVLSIVDRREAIRTACMLAKPGDVILVAGKGHEDYQIVQGVKHHFDDHEVIREAFGLSDK